MKIAFVTDGIFPYQVGGMQRHSFNLVRHLAGLGVEIDLYHTDRGTGQDIHQLEEMLPEERANINSIYLPWPRGDSWPGHYLRELAKYSKAALEIYQDRSPADFIYTKSLTGQAFMKARQLSPKRFPPIGIKAHGYEMFQRAPDFRTGLQQIMLKSAFKKYSRMADIVFSYGGKISELLLNRLKIPPTQIREISGAVAGDWISQAPISIHTSTIQFVFVGRYERRKGIQELHQAITAHPQWQEKAHFTFIGPIPQAVQLALPHVNYLGQIVNKSDMRNVLANNHILITPSHSEGMPNVILEGMANGLAPVATDVGAVSTLVNDTTGWLLSSANTEQIAKSISQILETPPAEIDQKRLAAWKLVTEEFTWPAIAEKTRITIQQFLEQNQ